LNQETTKGYSATMSLSPRQSARLPSLPSAV
jgi:hypothetical protein